MECECLVLLRAHNSFSLVSTMQSDSGWTDNELCEIWFRESFIPNVVARRVDDEKPIVLTFDGHESHETPAIKRLAYDNNIVLFCLPSKTTHKLQPLDVGVFSVLQRAWNAHCGDLAAKRIVVNRYNLIPEYLATRNKVITPHLIIKAFWKTGIFPFNPSIFSDGDFGPSMASSSMVHVPSSYPDLTPSSPPATLTDDEDSDDDFIQESSSDMEMDCDNGDNSNDGGCEAADSEDEDNFRRIDPHYEIQSTSLLNSDTNMLPPSPLEHRPTSTPPEHHPTSTPPECDFLLVPPAFSTRSHSLESRTSPAMPISSTIPDWKKDIGQLLIEKYKSDNKLYRKDAELKAAKAHCTIMVQALADAHAQLANLSKKKTRGTNKIKARWVALPELQDSFEAEETNRKEQEWCNTEKEARKQASQNARQSQIIKDTVLKVFDRPFSVYRRKDELIVLAGALELDTIGTIPALKQCIKSYLNSHKDELMQVPRFIGLFQARQQQRAFDGGNCDRVLGDDSEALAGPSQSDMTTL